MKRLIYSIFAFAALALASACDKQNPEPRPYLNTWVVNFNETEDATKDEWAVFILNADGTTTFGDVFTKDVLADYKANDIDTEKLTEEQKAFVDGLQENDVCAMEGWYSIKSHVLCFVADYVYDGNIKRQHLSLHVKEVTKDHMLIFNGYDDQDEPVFCKAYSLETSPLKLGTFYEQKIFSEIPLKQPERL